MGVLKRAGDLVYTFRFLKLLTTNFEDTSAFKLGLIDKDGQRIKSQKIDSASERDAYTPFHRLVFNIKKLMAKAPGGSSKIASYAAALYLLKEKFSIPEKQLKEALEYCNLDILDFLNEGTEWFLLEDKQLSPGIYKLRNNKVLNSTCEDVVSTFDKVRISEDCYPIGEVFGIDIYEANHVRTNQPVYVAIGELTK